MPVEPYGHRSGKIVLQDRLTGALYRLSAPGGVFTTTLIGALGPLDDRLGALVLPDVAEPGLAFYVWLDAGAVVLEATNSRTRPYTTRETTGDYLLLVVNGTVTAVLVLPGVYDDAIYDLAVYGG